MPNHILIDFSDCFISQPHENQITLNMNYINPTALKLIYKLIQSQYCNRIIIFVRLNQLGSCTFNKYVGNQKSLPYRILPFLQALKLKLIELSNVLQTDIFQLVYFAYLSTSQYQPTILHSIDKTHRTQLPLHNDDIIITSNTALPHLCSTPPMSNPQFLNMGTISPSIENDMLFKIWSHLSRNNYNKLTLFLDLDNSLLNNHQSTRLQEIVLNAGLLTTLYKITTLLNNNTNILQRVQLYFYTARLTLDTVYNHTLYSADRSHLYNSAEKIKSVLNTSHPKILKVNGVLYSEWYRYKLAKGEFLHRLPCLNDDHRKLYQPDYLKQCQTIKDTFNNRQRLFFLLDDRYEEGRDFTETLNPKYQAQFEYIPVARESDFDHLNLPCHG